MALEKILDDYVLKFYEIFPKIPGKINKEITRDEFLSIVGNETFGEIIKWEYRKLFNQIGIVESTDLKTGETRFFEASWVRTTFFFED